jgi:hypothetical protein
MPDITGEAIDRVCTIEARNRGMPHDFILRLYDAARKRTGGRPISTLAAEQLIDRVGKGDVVLVLTGAGLKPILPEGENDGPPGAAALARALYRGLGAVPVYVLERHHARPVIASSHSIGLMVKEFQEAKDFGLGSAIEYAPPLQEGVPGWVDEVLDRYDPKAVICTERIGPGKNGVLHSATGMALPDFDPTPGAVVDTAPLVEEASRRGVLTVGIGDHGNEVGFGGIYDTVVEVIPKGETLAATTVTDILFPVMMSNWGCYGIEAALAFLLNDARLMHTPAQEERMLRDCLNAGGLEAAFCTTDFFVDGLEGETSMAAVQFLGNIVRKNLERASRGLAH